MNLKKVFKTILFLLSLPFLIYVWEFFFLLQIAAPWPLKIIPLFTFSGVIVFLLTKNFSFRARLRMAQWGAGLAFLAALIFELSEVTPNFEMKNWENPHFQTYLPSLQIENNFLNRYSLASVRLAETPVFSFMRNDSVSYVMRSLLDAQFALALSPYLGPQKIAQTCKEYPNRLNQCLNELGEELYNHQELTATGKVILGLALSRGAFSAQQVTKKNAPEKQLEFTNALAKINKQILTELAIPLKNQNILTQYIEEEIRLRYMSIAVERVKRLCETSYFKFKSLTSVSDEELQKEFQELSYNYQDFNTLAKTFNSSPHTNSAEELLGEILYILKDKFLFRLAYWYRPQLDPK